MKFLRFLRFLREILHLLEVRVRLAGVEDLVAVHHRHQILGVGEVDNVVRVAWQHVDALDVVAAHLELDDLVGAEFALLDEAVT